MASVPKMTFDEIVSALDNLTAVTKETGRLDADLRRLNQEVNWNIQNLLKDETLSEEQTEQLTKKLGDLSAEQLTKKLGDLSAELFNLSYNRSLDRSRSNT
jgi:ribosomal protein L29